MLWVKIFLILNQFVIFFLILTYIFRSEIATSRSKVLFETGSGLKLLDFGQSLKGLNWKKMFVSQNTVNNNMNQNSGDSNPVIYKNFMVNWQLIPNVKNFIFLSNKCKTIYHGLTHIWERDRVFDLLKIYRKTCVMVCCLCI